MLPNTILEFPPLGCINVHASLLPKYRGAAPIQWAIAQGERETGVTIMRISERMDAGDILLQRTLPIEKSDTGGSLHDKLSHLGAEVLQEALQLFKQGQLSARQQNESEVTYAPIIKKEDGRIDWTQEALVIERRIRVQSSCPPRRFRETAKNFQAHPEMRFAQACSGNHGSVSTFPRCNGQCSSPW